MTAPPVTAHALLPPTPTAVTFARPATLTGNGAHGALNQIVGGWALAGIVTLRTGLPFTPTISSDTANTGVGGTNTSTTAGTANAALTAFEAAVGGANNGANPPPQASGFRAINWDAVPLNGVDGNFADVVIDAGHVVGIPLNRFQERGVEFEQVYAVSGPASASDASTFTTVNPTVTPSPSRKSQR